MAYKYFIDKKEKGYRVGLYPNNNNKQPMIWFDNYKTIQEAMDAILNFKNLIHSSKKAEDIIDTCRNHQMFWFRLKENKYRLTCTSRMYNQKANLNKAISAIYKHVDAELKDRSSYPD